MLPLWARKPNHSKKVIATDRGWVVEQTGEVLKSIKGLDKRLTDLYGPETVEDSTDKAEQTTAVEDKDSEKAFEEELNKLEDESVKEPVEDFETVAEQTTAVEDKDSEKENQKPVETKPTQNKNKSGRGRPRKK